MSTYTKCLLEQAKGWFSLGLDVENALALSIFIIVMWTLPYSGRKLSQFGGIMYFREENFHRLLTRTAYCPHAEPSNNHGEIFC